MSGAWTEPHARPECVQEPVQVAELIASLVAAAERGDTSAVQALFGTLFERWVTHHQRQEACMREAAYPRLPGHHLAHMVIRYQLSVCAFKLAEAAPGAPLDAALLPRIRHLRQLMQDHLRDFDHPLAAHLAGHSAGGDRPASSDAGP